MSRKSRDELLNKLEFLKIEYYALYETVKSTYEQLNSVQEDAYTLADESACLVASIKHAPITVTVKARKVATEKQKIIGKNELCRQERNRNIAGGAAAVATLVVGGVLATTFKDFFVSFAKKFGKYGGWIIAIALIVIVLIGFLIWKAVNRAKTIRQATKAIKTVSKENANLKIQQLKANQNIEKINMQMSVVSSVLESLKQYESFSYLRIPRADKPLLMQLVNDTLALTGILGEDI